MHSILVGDISYNITNVAQWTHGNKQGEFPYLRSNILPLTIDNCNLSFRLKSSSLSLTDHNNFLAILSFCLKAILNLSSAASEKPCWCAGLSFRSSAVASRTSIRSHWFKSLLQVLLFLLQTFVNITSTLRALFLLILLSTYHRFQKSYWENSQQTMNVMKIISRSSHVILFFWLKFYWNLQRGKSKSYWRSLLQRLILAKNIWCHIMSWPHILSPFL